MIGIVVSAIIGAKWGKNSVLVTVNIDGKNVTFNNSDIQKIADENEELKNKISDYEKQIDNLESEMKDLSEKLGVANGKIDDFLTIEYKNYGLSIDGEEKNISKDKSNLFDRQMINKSSYNVEVKENIRDTYGTSYNKTVIVD